MGDNKPFIYICSTVRTGSTVIMESLTQHPYSFIFVEPSLSSGNFSMKEHEIEMLTSLGIKVKALKKKFKKSKKETKNAVKSFSNIYLPEIHNHFSQVGIKEIYHSQWRTLFEEIDNIKVVITVRDPRDMFLSLMEMRKHFKYPSWKWRDLTLEEIAGKILEDFERLKEIREVSDAITVKYEDFVTNPEREHRIIKKHIQSDIPSFGEIGYFIGQSEGRKYEIQKHGGGISSKSVERWKSETDQNTIEELKKFSGLMGEYMDFFNYDQ